MSLTAEEDELAHKMEVALGLGKGTGYILRSKHGVLKVGTHCRVWRAPNNDLRVWVSLDDLEGDAQAMGNPSGNGRLFGYPAAPWFLVGVDQPEHVKALYPDYYRQRGTREPRPF